MAPVIGAVEVAFEFVYMPCGCLVDTARGTDALHSARLSVREDLHLVICPWCSATVELQSFIHWLADSPRHEWAPYFKVEQPVFLANDEVYVIDRRCGCGSIVGKKLHARRKDDVQLVHFNRDAEASFHLLSN